MYQQDFPGFQVGACTVWVDSTSHGFLYYYCYLIITIIIIIPIMSTTTIIIPYYSDEATRVRLWRFWQVLDFAWLI